MIDLIGTLRRLTTAVGLIPTTAERGTDDATLQATWTDAMATALANYTAARAAYLDELAAANLPSDIDDLLSNLAIVFHQTTDYRTRVYPQAPSSVPTITTAAAADTFGSWTQVVPINTIDFTTGYRIIAFMLEQTNAAATYIIQFGYSTADGDNPTTAQIMGEQRFKTIGTPIKLYHSDLWIMSSEAPQNAKLWARLKSETVNADTCDISIVVTRALKPTNQTSHLTTWPWA